MSEVFIPHDRVGENISEGSFGPGVDARKNLGNDLRAPQH